MNRQIVDTNVIVRHLVQDDKSLSALAGELFARCDRGEIKLVILSTVVAECVFVLECFYKHPRDKIAATLAVVLSSPGVELAETETHLAALKHYTQTKLHFIDCLIAAHAAAAGLAVATFDKALLKITSRNL